MGRGPAWGAADIVFLESLCDAGLSNVEIAERMPGRTVKAVTAARNRYGLTGWREAHRMSPAQVEALRVAHEERGWTWGRIAEKLGVPAASLRKRYRYQRRAERADG